MGGGSVNWVASQLKYNYKKVWLADIKKEAISCRSSLSVSS